MWFQEETPKDKRFKEIGMHAQNMKTVLDSIMIQIKETHNVIPLNENKNIHVHNKWDIHTSSKIYNESGYDLDLDLLTVSYHSHVLYPRKKWAGHKINHSMVVYLNVNPLLGFLTTEPQNPKVDVPNLINYLNDTPSGGTLHYTLCEHVR